jgi:hypothetical protein
MNATDERPAHDYYKTPDWCLPALLDVWNIDAPHTILEPAAGDGALLPALRQTWPDATIDAWDIEPRHEGVKRRDFFWFEDTPQRYDLVITNPPYKHAEQFVRYGLTRLAPGGHLALFLRLGFLGSHERIALWKEHPLWEQYTLSERPSFKNGTTDFSEYAWFVWREGSRRRWWKGFVL